MNLRRENIMSAGRADGRWDGHVERSVVEGYIIASNFNGSIAQRLFVNEVAWRRLV